MTDVLLPLLAGLAAGAAVGVVVFGGLLATTRRLSDARRPLLLFALSLVIRMGLLWLVVIALARWGGWLPMLTLVPAMIAVRQILFRRQRSAGQDGAPAEEDRWA